MNLIKSHWEWAIGVVGGFATITLSQVNAFIACLIGVATFTFIACKAGIWVLKLRMAWLHRNNTAFWRKKSDDEETET